MSSPRTSAIGVLSANMGAAARPTTPLAIVIRFGPMPSATAVRLTGRDSRRCSTTSSRVSIGEPRSP
jgi:hypothetical protein